MFQQPKPERSTEVPTNSSPEEPSELEPLHARTVTEPNRDHPLSSLETSFQTLLDSSDPMATVPVF